MFNPFLHENEVASPKDYSRIARKLSHQLRQKIKDSYEAYNDGQLTGIKLTPDHIAYIKCDV